MTTLAQKTCSFALNAYAPTLSPSARRAITTGVLMTAAVALLTLSAKFKVPSYPVPMTLQTMVVLLIGLTYGARLGGASLCAYMAMGAMGYPVFAGTPEKGLGLAYMFGPTGGYLLGFFLSALLMGWISESRQWDRRIAGAGFAMLLGLTVIFTCGLIGLGIAIGFDKPLLALGLQPFVWGEIIKMVVVMTLLPAAWKVMERLQK